METNISEKDFNENAPKLLNELKEKALKLCGDKIVYDEITKLINAAELLFNNKKISETFSKYNEAKKKLEEAIISNESTSLAWKLLRLEIGYLIILLFIAYFTYKWPEFILWDGLINMHLQTAWFGALGGVTISIYGIFEHMHLRDFDPKFELWYVCKPIIGGIFGWFIYLIFFIGIVSVQGAGNVNIKTPELPFVIAFLAGFSERFTIKMIDKLMSVLTSYEKDQPKKNSAKGKANTGG